METLTRFAKERFPGLFYWLYGLKSRRYKTLSAREIFTEKFERNAWRGTQSRSGPGSSFENTRVVREQLPGLLESIQARSLLDIPCGDFYWMSRVEIAVEQYVGADIVEPLIEQNRQYYARLGREFRILDLLQDTLPKVDLIFCRDCLVHFSNADVRRALQQIQRSGSTYLLTTTYPEKPTNVDILTGQWRPLNLQIAPFDFSKPIQMLLEESTEQGGFCFDKSMGLWRVADLRL